MSKLWPWLLILSLGLNGWFGVRSYKQARAAEQSTAVLTWGGQYWLNAYADLLASPQWDDPTYRFTLYQVLDRATIHTQDLNSAQWLATGVRAEVVSNFSRLHMDCLTPLTGLAQRKAISPTEPFTPDEQARFLSFAKDMQEAGMPDKTVHRDNEAEWQELAAALDRLLQLLQEHRQ